MSIFRIYPEKDTFITSLKSESNAGIDEIVEVGSFPSKRIKTEASRILVQFATTEIQSSLNGDVNNAFSASINFKVAEATALPESIKVEAWPLAQGWTGGTGKINDEPINKTGCSWKYRNKYSTNTWSVGALGTGQTASYSGSNSGGGVWYTASNAVDLTATSSFSLHSKKDIDINVTDAIKLLYSESIANSGFILKLEDAFEFDLSSSAKLQYFSAETNTVYRPYLEFKWDDSVYNTGSLSVLNTDIATIGLKNSRAEYTYGGKQKIRVKAAPKYPTRVFTTGSIYKTGYALPEGSSYAIQDNFTKEMVIDFDTTFTKISCDSNGNYFNLYTSDLEPERYYKVLISSSIDGSELIIDDDNIFKIVKNG